MSASMNIRLKIYLMESDIAGQCLLPNYPQHHLANRAGLNFLDESEVESNNSLLEFVFLFKYTWKIVQPRQSFT